MNALRIFIAWAAVVAAVVALTGAPRTARADRRIFGWSYPYMTLPAGGFELEHYLDAAFSKADDPATTATVEDALRPSWTHQVEAEYALTDRWDVGFYNVFSQPAYGTLRFDEVKLRSRYRFVDQGVWPVDLAVYGEVVYTGDAVEFEELVILSRMLGSFELSLNAKVEQKLPVDGGEVEHELVPSFGAGYHVTEWFAVSLEYLGELEIEDGTAGDMAHFVGPTVSFAGRHFWWTIAYAHQVSGPASAPDVQVRSIFAVGF